jgi:putative protease
VPYAAEMPRYIVNEAALIKRAKALREAGVEYAYCENLSAFQIAQNEGFKIIAGAGLNIANSYSAKVLKDLGVEDILISVEQTLADIEDIDNSINKGIAVYGHLPLMLLRNCPMKNGGGCEKCKKQGKITDRMGVEFALKCREGYTELLNSKPIWLMDKKCDFAFADFALLYFSAETKEQVNEVLEGFKKSASSNGEYTRGMYYRGTL